MSSELLRRAAEKLRQHAEAATPGPWKLARYGSNWGVDGDVRPADHAWVAEMKFGNEKEDAELIALMGPPVALALADLFDRVAWMAKLDADLLHRGGLPEALAVARAVLREPDPTGGA